MGEILHHNFGAPKAPTKIEDKEKEEDQDNNELMIGLAKRLSGGKDFGERLEKLVKVIRKVKDAKAFLKSLRSVSTNETKSLRLDLVLSMSFAEKADAILNSDETQWKKSPTYYIALTNWFSPENLKTVLNEREESNLQILG